MHRAIPVVDMSLLGNGSPADKKRFVQQFGSAFREIGFAGVVNHGIDEDLVQAYYDAARKFFGLPVAVKARYEVAGASGQRGYTAFGREHAKGSAVADLKEFFQTGPEIDVKGGFIPDYGENVLVDEVPEFNSVGNALFRAFLGCGARLLGAIALYLGLDEDYFDEKIRFGNSILRAIHYPPITSEPQSAVRAESHEDINLITLLVGASAGGLEVLTREGTWLPVVPAEGEIVVNVGDMLQRMTNNLLRSTTHRVVNPPRSEWHVPRLSIPFFLHPSPEMDLTCLESCVTEQNPCAYEPIRAGQYLDQRLAEIGLKG